MIKKKLITFCDTECDLLLAHINYNHNKKRRQTWLGDVRNCQTFFNKRKIDKI